MNLLKIDKIDFDGLSNDEIISIRVQLEKEFKKRKIKFSAGEIGEKTAIDFFNKTPGLDNLLRANTGTKSVDALSKKRRTILYKDNKGWEQDRYCIS